MKALASAVLNEVRSLEGKGLSLTSIESWAYAAMIGKMTANSKYSIGLANLIPPEQTLFKTLSGINQFQGKLSSHSFSIADVTDIAKSFSDETLSLQNPNDEKFMQIFYSNLQAGQGPTIAAQNAYTTVPSYLVSQALQTFIAGLTDTNASIKSVSDLSNLNGVQREQNIGFFSSSDENPFGNSSYDFSSELI